MSADQRMPARLNPKTGKPPRRPNGKAERAARKLAKQMETSQ